MARNRFSKIARESAEKTDRELSDELSRLTRLTEPELHRLLPSRGDRERFAELMAIVDSSASANRRLKRLKDNIEELGPVILKVVRALG